MSKSETSIQASSLYVASLAKGFRVLECFKGSNGNLTIREICELSGFDRSTVQRLTNTLHKTGYLVRDDRTKRYRLGIKLLDFSFNYLNSDRLVEAAMPRLVGLSEALGTRVSLAVRDDLDVVLVVRIPRSVFYHPTAYFAERQQVAVTTSGRAIIAFHPKATQHDVLDRTDIKALTPYTLTSKEDIMKELEKARQLGYCVQVDEFILGETSVSAPVRDGSGLPIASILISFLRDELPIQEQLARYISPLLLTAEQVSQSLKGNFLLP